VSEALRSATKGRSYITKTKGIYNNSAVGYVTKYLTKHISNGEKGIREEQREMISLGIDANGNLIERKETQTVEVVSKARRIRYSRHFFPESVAELRLRLFAQIEGAGEITIDDAATKPTAHEETPLWEPDTDDEETPTESRWTLLEKEPFTDDLWEYRRRKAEALREVVAQRREHGRRLNRRLLSIWDYQRKELYGSEWDDEKSTFKR
jgi:hypothetical protein